MLQYALSSLSSELRICEWSEISDLRVVGEFCEWICEWSESSASGSANGRRVLRVDLRVVGEFCEWICEWSESSVLQ